MSAQEGKKAPAFSLKDQDGKTVKLADFKGKSVVLYFYPKDMTSGCTVEACDFRDDFGALKKKGAVVLGVSPDNEKSHQKFIAKHELPFPLLVDDEHTVAEAYGAWGEKSMYGRKYFGIVRSAFVIDESGKLAGVFYKVSPKDTVPKAMEALQG